MNTTDEAHYIKRIRELEAALRLLEAEYKECAGLILRAASALEHYQSTKGHPINLVADLDGFVRRWKRDQMFGDTSSDSSEQ